MLKAFWTILIGSTTVFVVAVVASAGGCSYDPNFGDGQLRCSTPDSKCPQGYECRNTFCYSKGPGSGATGGRTGTGGSGTGGSNAGTGGIAGGGGTPAAVIARFVGAWRLGPTSSVRTTCDDGFSGTMLLSPVANPSTMTITAGLPGVSDLRSSWLCPAIGLRVVNGNAQLFDSAPTCSEDPMPTATPPTPGHTWTATAFDIVMNNGVTAMHTAAYTRVDMYAMRTVNCTQAVTAPLIKN